jgi:hypothetical protein
MRIVSFDMGRKRLSLTVTLSAPPSVGTGAGRQGGLYLVSLLREPLIIPDLSLPLRNKYGINSGGSPVMSKTYGFLLEFIPMEIGAGMTFLEIALIL